MKRIICLALFCVLALSFKTACGRREFVVETEYKAPVVKVADFAFGSPTIASEEDIHEYLTLLGKVWGFAKYHHPIFLTGRLFWDAELLGLVSPILDDGDGRGIRK